MIDWFSQEPIIYPDYTDEDKKLLYQIIEELKENPLNLWDWGEMVKNLDKPQYKKRWVMSTVLSCALEDLKDEDFSLSKYAVFHKCEVIKQWRLKIGK